MDLYEKCTSLVKGPHVSSEEDLESISLLATAGNTSLHDTAPSFIKSDWLFGMRKSVYYISDLHLVHHFLLCFKGSVSEERIRTFIHTIVLQLFEGELSKDIKKFNTPIILFGGDISSDFFLAELFYRDFFATWEQIADEKYNFYYKKFSRLQEELNSASKLFAEWKEKHPWVSTAKRPLEEYSEKRVPRTIKELHSKISELTQKIKDKRDKLGLDDDWESYYKRARSHPYVYTILGNHELWDFESYDECETAYSKLFKELNVNFLKNSILPIGLFRRPILSKYDPEKNENIYSLLKREDDPKEYDQQLFYLGNLIIVGGLGFAAMNTSFNADQGIYGKAVSREEEIMRCKEWKACFRKATEIARKNHCSLVVLSHNPITDWMSPSEEYSNCFFFNGHTHRNIAYSGENNTVVFSDNQVGYKGTKFKFKKATLYSPRNPFASDQDGFREISCEEYKEYYCYVHAALPGTGIIERQITRSKAKLFVLKQDGYVGFFLTSPRGVYICNGGQIRRIGPNEPLDRYMANFMNMIKQYLAVLSPLRRFQEKLSSYVKSFGGDGIIHGTIVDIDFFNHIMVNTSDGTLTYYYSPMFGVVETYPDIGALLHARCPQLETAYQKAGTTKLIPVSKKLSKKSSSLEYVDIKNSPYAISRRINALQRLFDKHILRDWNPDLEIKQIPQ